MVAGELVLCEGAGALGTGRAGIVTAGRLVVLGKSEQPAKVADISKAIGNIKIEFFIFISLKISF